MARPARPQEAVILFAIVSDTPHRLRQPIFSDFLLSHGRRRRMGASIPGRGRDGFGLARPSRAGRSTSKLFWGTHGCGWIFFQRASARPCWEWAGVLTDREYRTVFEASPDATLIVDAGGVIRDLNPQAARMFGWPADEMRGLAVERLVPQESREEHLQHRQRYGKAPKPRPMGQGLELSAVRKDGTTLPVEISLSPSGLAGDGGWVICTVRDISGWKRMQRLSRMMVGAAELERKHLSRELHDDLLQYLVSLKIRAKLLADEMDPDKRAEALALISGEIQDAMRRVKRIITGLLPPELERRGLLSALRTVFRDAAEVYGFTVHSKLERLDGELDGDVALGLYRIVQEAVTNAARHAQVNEATVAVTRCHGQVIAEIRDEGCGFELPDPGAEPIDGRVGLAGMRDRAALIGGEVTVWTAPGEGTTVRATLPMTRPRPKH